MHMLKNRSESKLKTHEDVTIKWKLIAKVKYQILVEKNRNCTTRRIVK